MKDHDSSSSSSSEESGEESREEPRSEVKAVSGSGSSSKDQRVVVTTIPAKRKLKGAR